ncbi:MAG: hypothetical protein DMD31_17580 [Gemmatimonadetes bacterium]|nr:MAG: hypothetical protein DMD31_17580 [Gemmatimonadota bacterium]
MKRLMATLTVAALFVMAAAHVSAADLKAIHTQKTKDVVVNLASESGRWKQGKNEFVPGATLSPDKMPGRYTGTITFPDSGTRQVTVTWDGPAGKGSTKFSVSVR